MRVCPLVHWRLAAFSSLIKPLLQCFTLILAQSKADAQHFEALGAENVQTLGNLKLDTQKLEYDDTALAHWKESVGSRPVWLAASLHPEELPAIIAAHRFLRKDWPDMLTLIVPRHPQKAINMQKTLLAAGLPATLANSHTSLQSALSQVIVIDTLGELGLFYRLCPVVVMGGSFIAHGGQNPVEAARLGCAMLAGPHMENFAELTEAMAHAKAIQQVTDAKTLAEKSARYSQTLLCLKPAALRA